MKRLVQVLMVAAVLIVGAHRAQAAPIRVAEFVWQEFDGTSAFGDYGVFFKFSNDSAFDISDLQVVITSVAPSYHAYMSPTFLAPTEQSILNDAPSDALPPYTPGLFPFDIGQILSLTVSFVLDVPGGLALSATLTNGDFYDVDGGREAFMEFLAEVPAAPIPEPTSLALFGFAAAGAAFARRRRA